MTQYSSEPWNCNYETIRGKRSVSSVLRNVQQRKEYENRRTKQTGPRVRERVNETITTSCSQFTFHRRPTKNRNTTSATNWPPLHPSPPDPSPPPPPPPPQHRRLDRGLENQPSSTRTISGLQSTLGYGRDEYHNRCRRDEVSRSRDQSTVRKREVTYEQQGKASSTNRPSNNKRRRETREHSPSSHASLQIDQHKQQTQKRPPTQPSTSRKRAWMYAARTLTPDSDEDDESDEEEPSTSTKPFQDPHSDYEENSPNTGRHTSSDHRSNQKDTDSIYSNPKNAQSCSSVSSNSSSGTDTTSSSSSAEESESEKAEVPTPYKPQSSAQRRRSPHCGSTVPRKAARVQHSPPEAKRLQHAGDIPTHNPSAAGKALNASRLQGQANCTKKTCKSVSGAGNEQLTTTSSVEKKTNAVEPKPCRKKVSSASSSASASSAPKQQKPSAANRRQKQKVQDSKPPDFKKPAGRAKFRKTQPDTSGEKHSAPTPSPYEPQSVKQHDTVVEHTEAVQGEMSYPCATLREMCNELNDIPVPNNKLPTADIIETAEACASISCSNETWSEISQLEEVWEDMAIVNPLDITAPLLELTTDNRYEDHEPKRYENTVCERQSSDSYFPSKPEEIKCKTPLPQMTLDSLCEESVVNLELLLNPDLNPLPTLSATACVNHQYPQPTSPQASTQQQSPHPTGHSVPLNAQR